MKIGETICQFFFREKFFCKKSNNEESKHNEKTHKERTKQKEEVKRKSKEDQLLFRGVFFLNRNKGIKNTFFTKSLKTQTNGKMFFEDHAWRTVLQRKVAKIRKKGFSKRIILRKESMSFDFFENKTIFGRGPKRRLVKENQDKK